MAGRASLGRQVDTSCTPTPDPINPMTAPLSGRGGGAHSFRGSSRMTKCKEPSGCMSQRSPAPSRRVGCSRSSREVGESSWRDDAAPSSVGSGGSRPPAVIPGEALALTRPPFPAALVWERLFEASKGSLSRRCSRPNLRVHAHCRPHPLARELQHKIMRGRAVALVGAVS